MNAWSAREKSSEMTGGALMEVIEEEEQIEMTNFLNKEEDNQSKGQIGNSSICVK
jgi:hypothetical protein